MHWSWDFLLDMQNKSTWLALDISFASPYSRELSAKQMPRHPPGRFWGIVILHGSDRRYKCTVRFEKYAYTSCTTALPFQYGNVITLCSHLSEPRSSGFFNSSWALVCTSLSIWITTPELNFLNELFHVHLSFEHKAADVVSLEQYWTFPFHCPGFYCYFLTIYLFKSCCTILLSWRYDHKLQESLPDFFSYFIFAGIHATISLFLYQ